MNELQTVFTFFYALYFAVFTTITGKLHPFDTASIYLLRCKAIGRFIISVIFLDIAPLSFFYFVFTRLEKYDNVSINLGSLILLSFLSLTGMGIYRIYYGLMLIKWKNKYYFYDNEIYKNKNGIPDSLQEDIDSRPEGHNNNWPHIIPGIIWVLISVILTIVFLY